MNSPRSKVIQSHKTLKSWKLRKFSNSEENDLTAKMGWKNIKSCNQVNVKQELNPNHVENISKEICTPVSGNLIKLNVKVGDEVISGHPIAILNSMNINQTIPANFTGRVESISVKQGDLVEKGKSIAIITLPK